MIGRWKLCLEKGRMKLSLFGKIICLLLRSEKLFSEKWGIMTIIVNYGI